MPQLTPFFFINEIIYAFTVIVIVLYILSKYMLPRITRLFSTRIFINII